VGTGCLALAQIQQSCDDNNHFADGVALVSLSFHCSKLWLAFDSVGVLAVLGSAVKQPLFIVQLDCSGELC
jgi:hypothetical protein